MKVVCYVQFLCLLILCWFLSHLLVEGVGVGSIRVALAKSQEMVAMCNDYEEVQCAMTRRRGAALGARAAVRECRENQRTKRER